jgi:hypothetical protein
MGRLSQLLAVYSSLDVNTYVTALPAAPRRQRTSRLNGAADLRGQMGAPSFNRKFRPMMRGDGRCNRSHRSSPPTHRVTAGRPVSGSCQEGYYLQPTVGESLSLCRVLVLKAQLVVRRAGAPDVRTRPRTQESRGVVGSTRARHAVALPSLPVSGRGRCRETRVGCGVRIMGSKSQPPWMPITRLVGGCNRTPSVRLDSYALRKVAQHARTY